ncbi:hypothetical protein QBC46DRAFT_350657 [Diplogelasinospora grovesii]|uniref:RRM domain-containing protein n=1 Tax=Diplogelasinospora grovesii TaxID=303347 RepID=A0AAN6NEC4_9PEZI|nr:hypothetical protein QBC46DRAFT_350657 [Diplogelasinospora grovesii]
MATNGNGKQVAADFEKIINAGRDRKKHEALAAKIFNRSNGNNRRSSTPTQPASTSLASRAGVTKQRVSSTSAKVNGNGWTFDVNPSPDIPKGPRAANSLAARITNPNAGPAANQLSRQKRRAEQVAQALIRSEVPHAPVAPASTSPGLFGITAAPPNIPTGSSFNKGISIRGLAGPFVVMAQNFAPGTTAADIESAMTPVGGIVNSCRIVKEHPIVIAEIVFESKEGAENVIQIFNNQTADGRVLKVYPKVGGSAPTQPTPAATVRETSGNGSVNGNIVDGTMGFDDPMETDDIPMNGTGGNDGGGNGKQPPRGPAISNPSLRSSGVLYSDSMVRGGRGRGGRGGRGRYGR